MHIGFHLPEKVLSERSYLDEVRINMEKVDVDVNV